MVGGGPDGPALRRDDRLALGDDPGEDVGLEGRVQVGEVEGEVQFVALSIEASHAPHVADVGLAQEDPRRIIGVGDRTPAAKDLVHFRTLDVVNGTLAMRVHPGRIVLRREGVVA